MTEQVEKIPHKDGLPWENKRVFSNFAEADIFRKSILSDDAKQAKVKRFVNPAGVETFIVKVRTNPELIETEEITKKNKKDKKKQ